MSDGQKTSEIHDVLRIVQEIKGQIKQHVRPAINDNHALLEQILAELVRIKTPIHLTLIVLGQSIHIPGLQQEEDMSFTVARDHADEPFELDPIVIQDGEGLVDIPFTEVVESDNPDVVSVDGSNLHFGTFGNATVSRKVTLTPPGQAAPQTFNAGSAVFNVTPGTISVTGNINVPGLTPDPEPTP